MLVSGAEDIVVTGGGGWLGKATLEMLESAFGPDLASRVHVYGSSGRWLRLRSGAGLEVQPLEALSRLEVDEHLLVHFAFATRERVAELGIGSYIAGNQEISHIVGSHVRISHPSGVMAVSSGAVYLGDELETNPYGVLKGRDERMFFELAREARGANAQRLVIPRLFNLAGPFLNKPDHYVLGSIIEDIIRGGPIRLSAAKPVIRSYVHVADLVELCFAIMVGDGPVPDGPFDTAGERAVEVGELAQIVAQVLGRPDTLIERPPVDDTEPDRYVGNGTVMHALAEANGLDLKDLTRQIEDTAHFMGS